MLKNDTEPVIKDKKTRYQLHPAVGIARLGNSPDTLLLSPETMGTLPIACNPDGSIPGGKEQASHEFRDGNGMIKRQAARFKVLVYDDESPDGRELKKGDLIVGQGSSGPLLDIEWTVWLANKKASWYQFKQLEGEHGYAPDHPLRNADITDPNARQNLIIDPGPQTVSATGSRQSAGFTQGDNPFYPQNFPPPLNPKSIETLGEVNVVEEDGCFRLIVRGGLGNSGCWKNGPQDPFIGSYANNDGWFDDTSDGPVTAKLLFWDETDNQVRYQALEDPSWTIVAYPAFAPQIVSMITMNDVLEDVYIRNFAADTYLYGRPDSFAQPEQVASPTELQFWRDFSGKEYNQNYYPLFWRDIWPILVRPFYMQWVTAVLGASNAAHDISSRGDFAENIMSLPPELNPDGCVAADPFRGMRKFVYDSLRKPGEENLLYNERAAWNLPGGTEEFAQFSKELMPLLAGDNPITNSITSKFLRLTDTQLFLLRQWAVGKFINEKKEAWNSTDEVPGSLLSARDQGMKITVGALSNVLGGAFCPGGEVGWIMRNNEIWAKPYRLRVNPLYVPNLSSATVSDTPGKTNTFTPPALTLDGDISAGLQPGDLSKYMALPWQADFNECSTQKIDVTYEQWNKLYPTQMQQNDKQQVQMDVLWWPWHRPMQVYFQVVTEEGNTATYAYHQRDWAMGIPQSNAGDLKMVTAWAELGFVVNNYNEPDNSGMPYVVVVNPGDPAYQWLVNKLNKSS